MSQYRPLGGVGRRSSVICKNSGLGLFLAQEMCSSTNYPGKVIHKTNINNRAILLIGFNHNDEVIYL